MGPCVVCRSRSRPISLGASEACVRRLVRGVANLASTQGRADVGETPTAQTLGTLARKVLSSSRHAESRELARAVSAVAGTSERRQVTTQSSDPVGARSDKRRVAERDAVFFLEEQAELDAADGQDGLRRVVRRVENELQVRRHPEVLGEQDLPVGFDAVLVA